MSELEWLVWSNEHNAWWNPNGCGYTPSAAKAGRYSQAVADRICDHGGRLINGKPPEEKVHISDQRAKGDRTIHLTPEEFAVLMACADFAAGNELEMDHGAATAAVDLIAEMCDRFDLKEDFLDSPAAIARALKARQA